MITLLETFAAELDTTSEHLFAVLTKQAYIKFYNSILFFVFNFLLVAALVFVYKYFKPRFGIYFRDELFTICSIIIAIMFSISIIILGISATALMNPEYVALKEILTFVGK